MRRPAIPKCQSTWPHGQTRTGQPELNRKFVRFQGPHRQKCHCNVHTQKNFLLSLNEFFFFPAATCSQWGPMVVTHTLSFSLVFRKCTQQAHIRHYGPERWRNILCKKPNLARESPATTPQNAREQGARKSNKSACMAHTKRLSSPTHLHFLLPFSLESVDRSWKGTIDWFPGG